MNTVQRIAKIQQFYLLRYILCENKIFVKKSKGLLKTEHEKKLMPMKEEANKLPPIIRPKDLNVSIILGTNKIME